MSRKPPTWEEREPGVRVLKLYETDLNPDWPRIVILDLTADRFREFDRDPLGFDKKYSLYYPESPISWISSCAKPPHVKEVPPAPNPSRWTAIIIKGGMTKAVCAAFPYESS